MADEVERIRCTEVLENGKWCPERAIEGIYYCAAHGLSTIGSQWIDVVAALKRLEERFSAERIAVVNALLDRWRMSSYPPTREQYEAMVQRKPVPREQGEVLYMHGAPGIPAEISSEAIAYYDTIDALSPAEKGLLEIYKSASFAGVQIHELVGWDESSPRGLIDGSYSLTYLAFNFPDDLARRCAEYTKGELRPYGGFVPPQEALERETKRLLQSLSQLRGLIELVYDIVAAPQGKGWRLATHPVFRAEEFGEFLAQRDSRNVRTRDSLLTHYVNGGRLLRVRRGLYAVVPLGQTQETVQPDPFLLAARMAPDAVLAYHTALEFHGRAYSAFQEFTYLTSTAARPAEFRGKTFRGVAFPKSLLERNQESFGVETADRSGLEVRVTSLERTLVDILDRPAISGGWEEIWRSLESVEYFDLDRVTEYALLLDNATTVAKVGFYLEQHAEQLMVEESTLSRLRGRIPKTAHYLDRSVREPARLVEPWNIIVPERILNRTWEEVR